MDYQRLYSVLVGCVDDTLQYMGYALASGQADWEHMKTAAMMLKEGLLKTEELYISSPPEAPQPCPEERREALLDPGSPF